MVLILWVWILHQGTMDVFSCWRMLRWFCRFGIRVLWWSAWASSGMGDGAAGSRVTVRVRLGLVLVLILLSYSTCPHFVYDMPSEHQFFGDWWHIDWYFVWFLFLIFCKTCNFFTGVKINFVYCFFFFHLELKCQILLGVFVKKMNFCVIPKYTKFDIMVVFWWFFGFFGGKDAILDFMIKSP